MAGSQHVESRDAHQYTRVCLHNSELVHDCRGATVQKPRARSSLAIVVCQQTTSKM